MAKAGRIRATIQGRILRAKSTIHKLGDGLFIYKNELYDIDHFSYAPLIINLDRTKVQSLGPLCLFHLSPDKKKRKKVKGKTEKKTYRASLCSNLEDCPDVTEHFA